MTNAERQFARVRLQDARVTFIRARQDLDREIVAAYRAGVPQRQIAEDSGFSRRWIIHLIKISEPSPPENATDPDL
jgi:hypothetical protein